MPNQIAQIKYLLNQLYELGFTSDQIDRMICHTAGTTKLETLSSGKLQIVLKELENCVWFSHRCRSIS